MSNILVTGAAGFVGSHTVMELLSQGHKVVGIDNLNEYYDVRLKHYRLKQIQHPSWVFRQIDIESKAELKMLFEEFSFDAVINLAARAGVRYSLENPNIYFSTNLNGTLNLLGLMNDFGVKKFVLASTSSLYAGQEMPFAESLAVNEPISPYAASKKAAEVLAYTYHYLYGIDVSIVRYFTVYGPAGRPDMSIFRFIKWIDEGTPIELFGDGTQSRDFTYVSDIAKGTILALKNVGYEVINLGGGTQPIDLLTVINMIEQHLDKKAVIAHQPFHKADLKATMASVEKAKKLLAWKPQVNLEQGIAQSVDWYLKNKDLCSVINL